MTHDELLKKILKTGVLGRELGKNEWIYDNKTNALRAVVELHKPLYYRHGAIETRGAKCSNCNIEYPCETIQVIEKELQ